MYFLGFIKRDDDDAFPFSQDGRECLSTALRCMMDLSRVLLWFDIYLSPTLQLIKVIFF